MTPRDLLARRSGRRSAYGEDRASGRSLVRPLLRRPRPELRRCSRTGCAGSYRASSRENASAPDRPRRAHDPGRVDRVDDRELRRPEYAEQRVGLDTGPGPWGRWSARCARGRPARRPCTEERHEPRDPALDELLVHDVGACRGRRADSASGVFSTLTASTGRSRRPLPSGAGSPVSGQVGGGCGSCVAP